MIRPLRKRHTAMAAGFLALLAPVGLVAGVLSRPAEQVMTGFPAALVPAEERPSGRVDKASIVVDDVTITVRTWGTGAERFLQLAPDADVRLPDVLVYWAPGTVADPSAPPPNDAVLIGSFAGAATRSYSLPGVAAEGGSVVLYSLAHRRGLGSAKLTPGG